MVCISLLVRRRGKRRAEEWRRGSHSTLVLAEKRSGGIEARVYSRDPFRDCGEGMETIAAYSTVVETRDYKKGCCVRGFEHRRTRSTCFEAQQVRYP